MSGPLIKNKDAGRSVDGLFHISDWMPTFVSLAGGTLAPGEVDGVDQWSTLSTGTPASVRDVSIIYMLTQLMNRLEYSFLTS